MDVNTECRPINNGTKHDVNARIKEIALKVAPDYPNIQEVDSFEQLWAIESAYEGCSLANDDCHKLIESLRLKLGWSKEELSDYWKGLIDG